MNISCFLKPQRFTQLFSLCLLAGVFFCALAGKSQAALSFTQCPDTPDFQCATLDVPLDRSGAVAGTIPLKIKRKMSGPNPASTAIIALAGGPGQAALPISKDFEDMLKPALTNRDLLVFDQRGTGKSNPLHCSALSSPEPSLSKVGNACANQIGPARAFFRTIDSVNDIEDIRKTAGYEKLFLNGTSYGTKVALDYASRYPDTVEKLFLDSTVFGSDPFTTTTYKATSRVLNELCANGECKGITNNPVADVAKTVQKSLRGPLRTRVRLANGKSIRVNLSQSDLSDGVFAPGDLNPMIRAMTPAAFRAAAKGDFAPLGRLAAISSGRNYQSFGVEDQDADFSTPLLITTRCEEDNLPWDRSAAQATKEEQFRAALNSLSDSQFFPFTKRVAQDASLLQVCLGWPTASPVPEALGPPANVPTLILAGRQDLRTPLEDAQQVPSVLPQTTIVDVPFVGHSVYGSDFSSCTKDAIAAFAEGRPVGACTTTKRFSEPTPVPPVNLTQLRPLGAKGTAGRLASAGFLTALDSNDAALAAALEINDLPRRIGGLRGGFISISKSVYNLKRVVVTTGVEVSGKMTIRSGEPTLRLTITGKYGSGTLTFQNGKLRGKLNGRKIQAVLRNKDRSISGFKDTQSLLDQLSDRRDLPRSLSPSRQR